MVSSSSAGIYTMAGFFRQQLRRQLVRPRNGAGELQLRRARRRVRQRGSARTPGAPACPSADPPARPAAPPQRVHRAGGHHQPLVQLYFDPLRREHRAAGLGQPLPQLLLRHGAVPGLLRHIARGHDYGDAARDGAGAAQTHRLAPAHRHTEVHRDLSVLFFRFRIPPGPGQTAPLRLRGVLRPRAEHGPPLCGPASSRR